MTNATSTEPAANSERPAVGRVHLHNRVLARVSGPGTDKFLQGQFSIWGTKDSLVSGPRVATPAEMSLAIQSARVMVGTSPG